jgi:anti-sigma regulatory factor (Ser/Thr protein kinase)
VNNRDPNGLKPTIFSPRAQQRPRLQLLRFDQNTIRVSVADYPDIVAARTIGAQFTARLGFTTAESALIATVVSDLARGMTQNKGTGEIMFTILKDGARSGVEIVAHYSEITFQLTPDSELTGLTKLMDEFTVVSTAETGTTVTLKKWRGSASRL